MITLIAIGFGAFLLIAAACLVEYMLYGFPVGEGRPDIWNGLFDGLHGESLSEAIGRAGKDGTPRNFILNDGSIYSGMFYDRQGRQVVTDIPPEKIVRVEYP